MILRAPGSPFSHRSTKLSLNMGSGIVLFIFTVGTIGCTEIKVQNPSSLVLHSGILFQLQSINLYLPHIYKCVPNQSYYLVAGDLCKLG